MGWTIGIPSLKLNNAGKKSKHCGDFKSVAEEALEERIGRDPDIDQDRSKNNIYNGIKTAAELTAYSDEHVSGMRDASGRKIRSDAVRMCATVIKPPAAYINSLKKDEQKKFLDDSVECFRKIVDPKNIKSEAYHFDERGAHVHIFWEPITADGRLCAKELHNLQFFSRLNKEMPEFLRDKGWDIDDCHAFDKAEFDAMTPEQQQAFLKEKYVTRGRSSKQYKEHQEALNKALRDELEVLEAKVKEIDEQIESIKEKEVDPNHEKEDPVSFVSWCMRHIQGVQEAILTFCSKKYREYVKEREEAQNKAVQELTDKKVSLEEQIKKAKEGLSGKSGSENKEITR